MLIEVLQMQEVGEDLHVRVRVLLMRKQPRKWLMSFKIGIDYQSEEVMA